VSDNKEDGKFNSDLVEGSSEDGMGVGGVYISDEDIELERKLERGACRRIREKFKKKENAED